MKLKAVFNIGVRPILTVSMVGRESIDFDLSKAINKRELSRADNSLDILLRYLEYSKNEEKYFNLLDELHTIMIDLADPKQLAVELQPILDLVDDVTLEKFLVHSNYKSPSFLMDIFDDNIIVNKEGTREQTFTKEDYRDLVKMTIKIKAIIPIIVRYVYIHEVNINDSSSMRVYRVFNSLKDIECMPAYRKMIQYVDKNIGGDDSITELDISRVLTKSITRDKFSSFISLSILVYLGIAATPDNDGEQHSIVSNMFRLCKNKTAPNSSIMVNDPTISTDEDDSNSSVTDTYLSISRIPLGYAEEIVFQLDTMDKILQQIRMPFDKALLDVGNNVKANLLDRRLDTSQEAIMCWLYFDIIEAEYMKYLTKEIKFNLRVVAYALLKTLELDNLASLILSTPYEEGLYQVKSSTTPVPEELEAEFESLYSITINKRAREKRYGLSVLGGEDDSDMDLKELLYRPVIRRVSTVRWLGYHLPKDSNIYTINNAREEIIKLVSAVCKGAI